VSEIRIYDPALCCATGVCGVDIDQELVRISADIDRVKRAGGDIARFNLASEPLEFAHHETVRSFLQVAGSSGLPLVLVDGVTVMTGCYPSREQLDRWAGLSAAPGATALPLAPTGGRCCSTQAGDAQEPAGSTAGCC
jgi:hypothetical protein